MYTFNIYMLYMLFSEVIRRWLLLSPFKFAHYASRFMIAAEQAQNGAVYL